MDTQELLTFAEYLADESAKVIKPYFRKDNDINNKSKNHFDPVTEADIKAEEVMRALINKHYPNHGILGEEHGIVQGSSNLTWVLDPIDGTKSFITGFPLWGTLIALNDGFRPILGVMNQPFTNERYVGTDGTSQRNGIPIKTRDCKKLSNATLMCTSPEMFDTPDLEAGFRSISSEVRLIRYGGDCYAYCMLASGMVDIIIEANLKPYDVQALIPIIEGAGGVITTWSGVSAQNGGAIVACGDPELHQFALEFLSSYATD